MLTVFWTLGMILMLLIFSICLFALIYSGATLVFPALQAGLLDRFPMLTIFPQLEVLFWLEGSATVMVYFALIVAVLLSMYIWLAAREGGDLARLLASPLSAILPRLRSKNRWVMVAQLFLAVQFFQLVYTFLVMAAGIPVTGPPGQPTEKWELLLGLAEAPVYEEIVSRVALIGLPMFIVSITIRAVNPIRRDVSSASAARGGGSHVFGSFRYLWGGTVNRRSPTLVLLSASALSVISAVFFSAAHSNYGDWKLLPTFVAGLALAYAYLRGGLFASILLHFSVNMFSGAVLLAEENLILLLVLGAITLAIVVIGTGFFAYYCVYAANLISERLALPDVQRPPPLNIPVSGFPGIPQFTTVCPYCGWHESAYINGRLKCMNCGRER